MQTRLVQSAFAYKGVYCIKEEGFMKKYAVALVLLFLMLSLTGCLQETANQVEQQKGKVVYIAGVSKELVPLTEAYIDLHTIYTNPLAYSLDERVSQFQEDKKTIEDSYARIQALNVPTEFMDAHQTLLSSLKATIEVNNTVEKAVLAGTNVSQEAISTLDTATKQLKEFSSSWDRLKGLPEHQ